jgi:hypothetical protein
MVLIAEFRSRLKDTHTHTHTHKPTYKNQFNLTSLFLSILERAVRLTVRMYTCNSARQITTGRTCLEV